MSHQIGVAHLRMPRVRGEAKRESRVELVGADVIYFANG